MRITFLGSGNMTSAIAHGLINGGRDLSSFCFYDHTPQKYAAFVEKGAVGATTLKEALTFGQLIVLAVKPQHFDALYGEIKATEVSLTGKTILSIAAGITISAMEEALGTLPIIRAMPNTPLQVGEGITALCRNSLVEDSVWKEAEALFSVSGEIICIPEDAIPGIISLTGSSPAFVFRFIQALADGAAPLETGLSESERIRIAARIMIGSAKLLLESGKSPEALIRAVTSPKGTTEAANRVLEEGGFAPLVGEAMSACTARAHELAKKN